MSPAGRHAKLIYLLAKIDQEIAERECRRHARASVPSVQAVVNRSHPERKNHGAI